MSIGPFSRHRDAGFAPCSRARAAGSCASALGARRSARLGSRGTLAAAPRTPGDSVRVAHGVDEQAKPSEPDASIEAVREGDHLDVDGRVIGAEHFDAELVVLAIAALLGPLVAKGGREVPRLPRRRRAVLDEGPHDRRGPFGAQRVDGARRGR